MCTNSIKPAERIASVQEYYLQKKLKEVAMRNSQGQDIISLGIGGPDLMPPESAIKTMVEQVQRPDTHSYQLGIGIPELRRAYSNWYHKFYNVELDAQTEILPLSGSKEGITHITLAFLNPGDGVLVPDPGYPTYTSVSKLANARIIRYNLNARGGWQPDWEEIEKMNLDGVKLMWLNYPHMPTGARATRDIFRKAVEFGRRHNIVIINDNPYSFILNDKPLSLLQVDGARDIAIELNSLSKAHNMAGWRMGMVASNPRFIQWILRVKSNIDSGQFRPAMLAAATALAEGEDWFCELNAEYARRRKAAEEVMDALGCAFDTAQSGLFLWGKVPHGWDDSEAFADFIMDKARVFITPGFIFGDNGRPYIRISLCAPVDKLQQAAQRIRQALA